MKSISMICLCFACALFSCRKDVDRAYIGTYKGTARQQMIRYASSGVPERDTTYTDVLITVRKSSNSSRKQIGLQFQFSSDSIIVYPADDITIAGGVVDFYYSYRANPVVHTWNGSFTTDSLNLTYQSNTLSTGVVEWSFKAKKQ